MPHWTDIQGLAPLVSELKTQIATGGGEGGDPAALLALQQQVTALEGALADKADTAAVNTSLTAFNEALAGKADDADLTALAGTVAGKADTAAVNTALGTKADATATNTALLGKASTTDPRFSDARTPTAHSHSAADLTSGTVATARLGTGTASAATFLRGDGAWATPAGGASEWTTKVAKSANQDVTNNATVQNDSELKIAVLSGEVWLVQLLLIYAGSDATGDFKLDWGLPTVTGTWSYLGDSTTADAILVSTGIRFAAATALAAQVSLGVTASVTTPRIFKGELFFRAGASGDVQFKFGNAAAATGRISRVVAGSILQGKKLA